MELFTHTRCKADLCDQDTEFLIKVQRKSAPLLAPIDYYGCAEHVEEVLSYFMAELALDQDVFAVTIVLP